jgi:hypothetical protein
VSAGRVRCCVPFCARSRKPEAYAEFICSVHWPMTDKKTRSLFFRARRAIKKGRDLQYLEGKLWEKLKRQAIERAVGL